MFASHASPDEDRSASRQTSRTRSDRRSRRPDQRGSLCRPFALAALPVQRACAACAGEADGQETVPSEVHDVTRAGAGQPLDSGAQARFEPFFHHRFDDVRVHTGPRADAAARAVGALAYTSGRDIVFRAGQYAPASPDGRRLLAHELTHVLQQRSARRSPAA